MRADIGARVTESPFIAELEASSRNRVLRRGSPAVALARKRRSCGAVLGVLPGFPNMTPGFPRCPLRLTVHTLACET